MKQKRKTHNIQLRPLLYLLLGTVIALAVALSIVIVGLRPPNDDLRLLVQFMLVSGVSTIIGMYVLYQSLLVHWVNSLRWSMIVTVITTVLLVFFNVWATAQLMFINQHDLILTTALLVFGGITATLFGWFIANRIEDKIENISNGIEHFTNGNLDVYVDMQGQDELSKLAQMFNMMVEDFKQIEYEKQQIDRTRRDLVAWISHDLRTPLTAIQASLEAIVDDIVTEPEAIKDYVQNSLGEVENFKVLLDDLFAIAQLDAGHMSLKFVHASLSDLISDTVSGMYAHAQQRNITIKGDIDPNIDPVYMAPDKIQRVLHNLIDNAIRHTPESGEIKIRAYKEAQQIHVAVHNTGATIDPQHLPHIFEKFYRGEQARQQAADGHRNAGLGLAIARGFVEAHQGMIKVESQPDFGTRFSFMIPVKQQA
ncbi:MAG: HAMP domain-containing sensor histidine kinase [Anaerolineae bacterium]|nr:HAMP domain-containing sensor histidine kinase [Anaerolineae bacterium]